MQKINIEIAIGISFLLGLILPSIGLGGVFSLVVMGFVATFLTKEEITSTMEAVLPQEFSVYPFSSMDF